MEIPKGQRQMNPVRKRAVPNPENVLETPAYFIDFKKPLEPELIHQSNPVFDSLGMTGQRLDQKRRLFHFLHRALLRSWHQRTTVKFSRHRGNPHYSFPLLQIIEKLVENELAVEIRSKPRKPDQTKKEPNPMSRLIPTEKLIGKEPAVEPWLFTPDPNDVFVSLQKRKTGEPIPFDPAHPVAKSFQKKLARVNFINSECKITYRPLDKQTERFSPNPLQIFPIHKAVFTEDFHRHGRIYTDARGHQALLGIERSTIQFNGEPSVELDYAGFHARMLYHLKAGIDYRPDPYCLWDRTTEEMRLMAKVFLNALINADSPKAAVNACNFKMTIYTKTKGVMKPHKERQNALNLFAASRKSKLKFAQLLPLVMKKHAPIAKWFGKDMGIHLMRIDAEIAVSVLNHFARKCVPCLGVHDSFIVPKSHRLELRKIMTDEYRNRLDFLPKIN